ncbi:FecR domain-containing protein [Methylophilus aquaticus]|uniref:FecR family protein n=1 Tax=Methylophilus aquaticus TaxID=1971610 RepID=A0ABT9JWB3_9PROT|nr:FecR family protein [Methylophilus aquaticus]MDP8568345.1 FecR family protein [Methylophilus aquaticus]
MFKRMMFQPQPPAMETPDQQVLAQAVDWMLKLQSGELSAEAQQAFEHWYASHQQHAAAWQRLLAVQQTFAQVPHKDLAKTVLAKVERTARRKVLKSLATLAILSPAAWLGYRTLPLERWRAGYQTAVGEQKHLQLADGSRLVLNTDSALDAEYEAQRQIRLYRGELSLHTGHQDARPLVVITPHGTLTPLGTRFNVKLGNTHTSLAVTEGAVRIRLENGQTNVVLAGQQQSFSRSALGPVRPVDESVSYWQQGMLLAQDMFLADVLAELARYRSGVIRCHPDLRQLKVSGAFPLLDTDAALDLLQKTLPVKIIAPSKLWIMVEPAVSGVVPGVEAAG